jgi:hypothetical protein
MAAKNLRVNAVLEPALYERVETLAKREGVSLSQKVRDLVREALDLLEDEELESRVEARRRGATRSRWVSHLEVKRRLRIF